MRAHFFCTLSSLSCPGERNSHPEIFSWSCRQPFLHRIAKSKQTNHPISKPSLASREELIAQPPGVPLSGRGKAPVSGVKLKSTCALFEKIFSKLHCPQWPTASLRYLPWTALDSFPSRVWQLWATRCFLVSAGEASSEVLRLASIASRVGGGLSVTLSTLGYVVLAVQDGVPVYSKVVHTLGFYLDQCDLKFGPLGKGLA